MKKYHKIQTVFKRDPATRNKTLLHGEYSLPEFEYLKDCEWEFTEKINGTNVRIEWLGPRIYKIAGKTDNSQISTTLVNDIRSLLESREQVLCDKFPDGVKLYGEGCGPRIEKGGQDYGDSQRFVLFDVRVGEFWLRRPDVLDVVMSLSIPVVKSVGRGTLSDMVKMAEVGFNSAFGPFLAEGIVARPSTEMFTRDGHRIITKIKHRDFPDINGGRPEAQS